MVNIRVGTSGYSYSWNEKEPTPFEWYYTQGFPTVEINASFYRFPMISWINTWKKCPPDFDFTIKVNRSITHYRRLDEDSLGTWEKFKTGFKGIQDKITFWLFQMPPDFTATQQNINRILAFFEELNLGNSAVLEFRHPSWWEKKEVCREVGATFCSVDAPDIPRDMVNMNRGIYLRMHGREEWYSSIYTDKQLKGIIHKLNKLDAEKKYVYLNNDHGMLPNGKYLLNQVSPDNNK
ncbi:MAG: DUF72 domain-containing protein [Thermoproteota archaeon]